MSKQLIRSLLYLICVLFFTGSVSCNIPAGEQEKQPSSGEKDATERRERNESEEEQGPYKGGRSGKPINIVWFITEDMGPDFGCYGEPEAHTPNLDRFAEQGMRFTNAYTTTPVCSSSRSSFMTGMYAHSIDAHHHRSHRRDHYTLPEGVRIITDWLREEGYTTGLIKQFPDAVPWEGSVKRDWNFTYEGRAGEDRAYDTIQWSKLVEQEPFFAQVQVPETHRDFHGPRRADPANVDLPPYYPDHPVARKDWARYLDSVSVADRKFGQVMDLLESEGIADNTLVIFFGDHGRAMFRGKQWPYDSGLQVPLLIRWPEAIDPPASYEAGTVDDRLISAIDITATTLWSAGVQPPMLMQGRVFFGPRSELQQRKYVFGERGRGDETVFRQRTVRTKKYRYIKNYYPDRPFLQQNWYKERQYPVIDLMRKLYFQDKLTPVQEHLLAPDRPEEELYFVPDDPHQIHNLADSEKKKHRDALRRLRTAVEVWQRETNDQGRFPEDPEVRKRWKNKFNARFKEWAEKHPEKYRRYKRLKEEWKKKEEEEKQ